MSKKDDILWLLVIPINMLYHYSHKYLYEKSKEKNKRINGF
jgi:hypothetical protein